MLQNLEYALRVIFHVFVMLQNEALTGLYAA